MDWKTFIEEESKKDYYIDLKKKVIEAYNKTTCFPPYNYIYRALSLCPLDKVKVVILGQDPYHELGQANGLSFSVDCPKLPPSLINIYKEMANDLNENFSQDGDLSYLAKQGVLLLNSTLTVEEGLANSHQSFGWQIFTDNIIKLLNNINRPLVFILWGNFAIKKSIYLDNPNHYIIKGVHPSPLSASRGFFGSKPFSKCNDFLIKNNESPIYWIKKDYLEASNEN